MPPGDDTLRAGTKTELNTRLALYDSSFTAVMVAKQAYNENTAIKNTAISTLRTKTSKFYIHLNDMIDSEGWSPSVRDFYGIDANDKTVPPLTTEALVMYWAGRVVSGEALRVAAGGTALAQPSATEVGTLQAAALTTLDDQTTLYDAYNAAQETLVAQHADVDPMMRAVWDEIESKFSRDNDPASRRAKAEQWGVVYKTVGVQKIEITLTVLNAADNTPLPGAIGTFENANLDMTTGEDGTAKDDTTYLGADTLTVDLPGFVPQIIPVNFEEGVPLNIVVKLVAIV